MMKDAQIKVWTFPPHVTHLLQPLDGPPFASLKRQWQSFLVNWCYKNIGQKLSKVKFFDVAEPAFTQGLMPQQIVAGFTKTGVYPIDRSKIKLKDMGPSATTNLTHTTDSKLMLHCVVLQFVVFNSTSSTESTESTESSKWDM
jgi:hypothetical protein